jgi:hypothetical protein
MYGASGVYSLIGPLATTEAIETTKFLLGRLGSSVEGVFALTSYADLERWAADKGALSPPEMAPAPVKRLPKGTVPVQAHEPGCAYAEQGHPGGCYIPPSAPQVINTNTPPWS